jgi:pimeloyl-ACP methyl ester carboxylesterase
MGTTRFRRVAWALAGIAALGVLFAVVVVVRTFRMELRTLESSHYPVPRPPGEPWLAAATDVSLVTPHGVTMRGWRVPSANGAAVLLVHGAYADRTQRLGEARILVGAGYGVLLFDLPGNGESGGRRRRGDEQDFIRAGIDALASSPDVQAGRVGAFGFSTGAAVLSEIAAQDPRVRGVVLAGCYTDTEEHIRHDYGRWGALSGEAALWAARYAGLVPLHPLANVPAIAPRSVFFIQGDADPIVNHDSAARLYAAAREPKALWIIPGVGHGGFLEGAGPEYGRRLVSFYDRALRAGAASAVASP